MCTDTHGSIACHQNPGLLARTLETLHLWRERRLHRRELARWTERDLHDVGLCWCDVVHEAAKPFWRA